MRAILKDTVEVGDALPSCSRQYTLKDFVRGDEKTIHTDQAAAEREGLSGPVAIGPQVAALLFRVLRQSFGRAWVEGASCSMTFRRPVSVDAFCTATGIVTEVERGADGVVVHCDIWVEDGSGTKVIVGNARSVLVAE